MVPSGHPISFLDTSFPPSISYLIPVILSEVFEIHSTIETAAILASASPRKPRLVRCSKSVILCILLVACLKNAFSISPAAIPQPLSVIRIISRPPFFISTVIAVDFASIAFSTSSLITAIGFSTTSPAAILLIVISSNTLIKGIKISPSFSSDIYTEY